MNLSYNNVNVYKFISYFFLRDVNVYNVFRQKLFWQLEVPYQNAPSLNQQKTVNDQKKMEIGCCGLTDSYEIVAEMGYDYIELSARQIMLLSDKAFDDFRLLYENTALPCRGFNDFCNADLPLVGPDRDAEKINAYCADVVRRGSVLGIRSIGIGAPFARILPDGYPKETADREMMDFLTTLNRHAKPAGIMILLEAVHQGLCNYLCYTKEAFDIVQRFQDENVRMVLDYYHAAVMKEDMHDFSYVMPYVKHLHYSSDLEGHARGYVRECDVEELFSYLKEAAENGYAGGISVEAAQDKNLLIKDGKSCESYMRRAVERI